jgi:hypothetical protein
MIFKIEFSNSNEVSTDLKDPDFFEVWLWRNKIIVDKQTGRPLHKTFVVKNKIPRQEDVGSKDFKKNMENLSSAL